jgi:hypothetical protein
MLVALPGNQLAEIAAAVQAANQANSGMAALYNEKKAAFA